MRLTLLVALLSSICCCSAEDRPIVSLKSGKVRGRPMTTRKGHPYFAFTSIPYAKPPLGPLRFKEAEPVDHWDGVLDASKELPVCLQIPIYNIEFRDSLIGSDDCLYLSVFSKNLSEESNAPVMVYIHGGSWRYGNPGNGNATKSRFLMDEDVVLVMFNYRLGALGFLSTEDGVIPSNLGLKDMATVVHWLHDNIAKFGGDPNSITVFGESVGGVSVHYLLLSPLTRDLVKGGISQSGVGHALWTMSLPGMMVNKTKTLARHLGCPTDPHQELVSCLRTKTAAEITEGERIFHIYDEDPMIVYPPVVEGPIPGAFLPDSPYNMHVKKPWMVGLTSADGAFRSLAFLLNPKDQKKLKQQLIERMDVKLMYDEISNHREEITKAIKERYVDGDEGGLVKRLNLLFTDSLFLWPITEAAESDNNFFYYYFDHRGKSSFTDFYGNALGVTLPDQGPTHTDDLLYLFDFNDRFPDLLSEQDYKVSERMIKYWVNFAKTGKPTTAEDDIDWIPYNKEKNYNHIQTEKDEMKQNLLPEVHEFWHRLPTRDKMQALKL